MDDVRDTTRISNGRNLYKKTARLCVALYRLTDYFDNEEPLKKMLRNESAQLLRSTVSFTKDTGKDRNFSLKDIKDRACAISAIFNVLLNTEYVSLEHGQIIKDELLSLTRDAQEYLLSGVGNAVDVSSEGGYAYKIDDELPVAAAVGRPALTGLNILPSRTNGRRGQILEYIRKNGPSTIRDVAGIVRGVSEKTIQRELFSLIQAGQLKKEGERRWSKYYAT